MNRAVAFAKVAWFRVSRRLSLFLVAAFVTTAISGLRACCLQDDASVGILIASAMVGLACVTIAAWRYIREPLVVFAVFGGVGSLIAFLIQNKLEFAAAVGGFAGLAGCVSWMIICRGGRYQRDARWIVAGAIAGVLMHPMFWLSAAFGGHEPLLPLLVCEFVGFVLFGGPTIAICLLAATLCRFALPRLFANGDRACRNDFPERTHFRTEPFFRISPVDTRGYMRIVIVVNGQRRPDDGTSQANARVVVSTRQLPAPVGLADGETRLSPERSTLSTREKSL
jgi:hypothetical protein